MGADGHIRIYDAEKVRAKAAELGCDFPIGWYFCDWTCNGRPAVLAYWGDNMDCNATEPDAWLFDDEKRTALKDWCNANAVIIQDQEVWT